MRIPLPFGLGPNPTIPSPRRCRRSATGLGPSDIDALPRKWLARLPASVHRGRSGRRPPPRPVDPAGRVLPDPDARDTDLGSDLPRAGHPRQPRHRPPDQVGLVFDPRPIRCPRATPGRFRTRVITWVVADSLDAE